jgi:hypothetical protein
VQRGLVQRPFDLWQHGLCGQSAGEWQWADQYRGYEQ